MTCRNMMAQSLTYHCPFGDVGRSVPGDPEFGVVCVPIGRLQGETGSPSWSALPVRLVHPVRKHVVLCSAANLAPLNIHDGCSIISELDKGRGVAPSRHDVSAGQGLEATHGASIHAIGVEVLLDDMHRHLLLVDLEMQTAGEARLLTRAGMLAVVVKHGDVRLVLVEARVVLPAEVGGSAVAEVLELVALATEDPDWMSIRAVNQGQQSEVSTGHEIVASLGLHGVLARSYLGWDVM